MDLTQFYSRYTAFASQYRIPPIMAQHGLTLLQRCVHIEHCNETNLRLLPGVVHADARQHQCQSMVYLLIKYPAGNVEHRAPDNNISVSGDTMIYAGQTGNFDDRERRRGGIMSNSAHMLCFGHDLTQYQQDCLELAVIIFSFLVFGHRTKNVTPYPQYVYYNVPASISIDRAEDHAALRRTNSYNLLRQNVLVGRAPSRRIMNLPYAASPSLARLLDFFTHGHYSIVSPSLSDHFPDIPSEIYNVLCHHLTLAHINEIMTERSAARLTI